MKVQDVRKECLATVGLSIEFSNSEISSLSSLLATVSNAIKNGIKQATTIARAAGELYGDDEEIAVAIDLKTLKRVEWLLIQFTRRDMSGLFCNADEDYRLALCHINEHWFEEHKDVEK